MIFAKLDRWRTLFVGKKPFLAALHVYEHPRIAQGPIITSNVVEGELIEGGVVRTKSGTIYKLLTPLEKEHDCEFARGLLVERASVYFINNGKCLKIEDLNELYKRIDVILSGVKE